MDEWMDGWRYAWGDRAFFLNDIPQMRCGKRETDREWSGGEERERFNKTTASNLCAGHLVHLEFVAGGFAYEVLGDPILHCEACLFACGCVGVFVCVCGCVCVCFVFLLVW